MSVTNGAADAAAEMMWNLHAQDRSWDELREVEQNQMRHEAASVLTAVEKAGYEIRRVSEPDE